MTDDLMDELRAALLAEHDDHHPISFAEGCGCETCQLILRVWEKDHAPEQHHIADDSSDDDFDTAPWLVMMAQELYRATSKTYTNHLERSDAIKRAQTVMVLAMRHVRSRHIQETPPG